jgi:hypothetical protein
MFDSSGGPGKWENGQHCLTRCPQQRPGRWGRPDRIDDPGHRDSGDPVGLLPALWTNGPAALLLTHQSTIAGRR